MQARTVNATEARVRFGELMRRVVDRGEAVVVERDGKPQVVIVAVVEYERLRQAAGEATWEMALRRAEDVAARIASRRRGAPLPPAVDMLHEAREERDARFDA
jgi:prevent-host-death family protein